MAPDGPSPRLAGVDHDLELIAGSVGGDRIQHARTSGCLHPGTPRS